MKAPTPGRMWETFLRVGESAQLVPQGEGGVDDGSSACDSALATLVRVKNDVLPFVRYFEHNCLIDWYSFLIHDRMSGVPCLDNGAYVHLRVSIRSDWDPSILGRPLPGTAVWEWPRPMSNEPILDEFGWRILGEQSAIVLDVIEHYKDLDGLALLQQLGQTIHYFSNMVQLPFPRPAWMG